MPPALNPEKVCLVICFSWPINVTVSLEHFVPSPLHALLRSLSHTLESLHAASGHDALLLVVSPTDDTDGWLGGTPLGRKFWQDLRGGGIPGARAFKAVSQAAYLNEPKLNSGRQNAITAPPAPPDLKDLSSRETKTELYRCMRDSLRFFRFSSFSCLAVFLRSFKASFRRPTR